MPKVGLFGGTFDPIHSGHLRLARTALRRFRLDCVYFIPSGLPPHKSGQGMSPFLHRYAMVALACSGEARFVPSLLEAGTDLAGRQRHYSADTVASVRRRLGREAKIYFLMGADQYKTLTSWKRWRKLVAASELVVAARPGVALRLGAGKRAGVVHLLDGLKADVSAREIRRLVRAGERGWRRKVPANVAEYIESVGLYRGGRGTGSRKGAKRR